MAKPKADRKAHGPVPRPAIERVLDRIAYEPNTGCWLFEGNVNQVLHSCDVPCCCNPQHLWLGTHQDNVDDKMRKGRHVAGRTSKRGSANGNSKLTEAEVRHIKRREMPGTEYAVLYSVSTAVVSQILTGKTWNHVE